MTDTRYIKPLSADSGEVWILQHTHYPNRGWLCTFTTPYLDPAQAIHDLAEEIRPRWSVMANPLKHDKPKGMPETPPANDYEAVAWFFDSPYPQRDERHESYELYRRDVRTEVAEPADGPEHVIVQSYREILCICGNEASSSGFAYVDEHGRDVEPCTPSLWLRCNDCGRIIVQDTGAVVKTIGKCAGCNQFVIAVPLAGLVLGEAYPFVDGDGVWVHASGDPQDPVYARCTENPYATCLPGSEVAAPPSADARRCGQCGGDRADRPHRHAAQHPRAEWLPEHAATHPEA